MTCGSQNNADVLKKGLRTLRATRNVVKHLTEWPGILGMGGMIAAVGTMVKPRGPGGCDHNGFERIANVVTSFPFVAVGVQTIRKRQTQAGKVYGGSIVGVGVASALFHSASGKWRSLARKLDYWTIAVSTTCMTRAMFPNMSPLTWAVCLAMTPFQPFVVSSANTMAMEVEYLRRANDNPKLRNAQRFHGGASGAGVAFFFLEEAAPEVPLSHSMWHCAACVSCATTNGLLANVEKTELGLDI